MRTSLRSVLLRVYKKLPISLRRTLFRGRARYCPVCESHVWRFVEAGIGELRPDAKCPVCGSEERHRFAVVFLSSRMESPGPPTMSLLHVAPAPCLEARLKSMSELEYTAVDLVGGHGRIRGDLTALPFGDDSFDVACCSHVLEHIVDDFGAMRELRRVVRPTGWVAIQVPITATVTMEAPDVTSPCERERVFGQSDHVRRYGQDFAERLRDAGFAVGVARSPDVLSLDERRRMAIPDDEEIYVCGKEAQVPPDGRVRPAELCVTERA